jgi:polyhydroxyalkanoate synthesis regulator phasin
MSNLSVVTDNLKETESLIKEALAKEKIYLQMGINKTKNRIREFEDKYSITLDQIIGQEKEIDHTDLAEWEGEVEVLRRLIKKIQNLEQIEIWDRQANVQ